MSEFSRLTGAQFVETNDFESGIINIMKVDNYLKKNGNTDKSVGYCNEKKYWWDVSFVDYGGDSITDYEKWTIWHEVGHATGLMHPNNDDSHSDDRFNASVSVMSDNLYPPDFYPTKLRDLDVQAMRNVWGNDSAADFAHGTDPSLPVLSIIEAKGNTELLEDSNGNAFIRQDGYENLLTLRDVDEVQYKIDGTSHEDPGEWKVLAAENIGGQNQVLWGYFGGQLAPSQYYVYDNYLWDDENINWYWYEDGDANIYNIGTPEFDNIANLFGIDSPDTAPKPEEHYVFPVTGNTVTGTEGKDKLRGKKSNDSILGLGANDKLNGKKGDDILEGGDGNDSIKGAKGDDYLMGSKGADLLIGGKGADVFKTSKGVDVVNDFSLKQGDRVGLNQGTEYEVIDDVDGTLIKVSDDIRMLLLDQNYDDFMAAGNDAIARIAV